MIVHYNNYNGLKSGPFLREAGVGGSNPLTPTNELKYFGNKQLVASASDVSHDGFHSVAPLVTCICFQGGCNFLSQKDHNPYPLSARYHDFGNESH